jgi:AraC family transcriptional regulator of adaptative response / DNA-3-methyladenine glycosylase II
VPGAWDPFEVGVRAILGQQVTVAGASTLAGRLVARLGAPVGGLVPLGLSYTFPSASVVARADLSRLGIPVARTDALRAFARAVADDDLRLDRSVGLPDLVASLAAVPGLGPWTAEYVALRIGEPDAIPVGDLGLRRSFGGGTAVAAAALAAASEAWHPWRALAAVHLWTAGAPERPAGPSGVRAPGPAQRAPAPTSTGMRTKARLVSERARTMPSRATA